MPVHYDGKAPDNDAAAGEVAACATASRCGAGGGGFSRFCREKTPHAVAEHGLQMCSYNGARGCRPNKNRF